MQSYNCQLVFKHGTFSRVFVPMTSEYPLVTELGFMYFQYTSERRMPNHDEILLEILVVFHPWPNGECVIIYRRSLGKRIRCQIHLLRQNKKLRRFSIAYYVLVILVPTGGEKGMKLFFFWGDVPLCFSDWGDASPRPPAFDAHAITSFLVLGHYYWSR